MRLFHFLVPRPSGNFGDDVLFQATKDAFCRTFGDDIEWIDYPLRNHTTNRVIEVVNSCDAVVVGGGGLLLKDTAPNSVSGWQWACSIEHLRRISVPLIVFSIGYNRFRGQDDFDPVFFEHMQETINKAAFFSVRNSGSRQALLNSGLTGNIFVNPCPSLFYAPRHLSCTKHNTKRIAFNLAGDRQHLRFDKDSLYSELHKCIDLLKKEGWEIHFLNHNWNPASNCQDFIDSVQDCIVHDIETNWTVEDIDHGFDVYHKMNVVVGMRGHAQLIPFGRGIPVISLISHDKLKWFLNDVDMQFTGVEANEFNMGESLFRLVRRIHTYSETRYLQQTALTKLRAQFDDNMNMLKEVIS